MTSLSKYFCPVILFTFLLLPAAIFGAVAETKANAVAPPPANPAVAAPPSTEAAAPSFQLGGFRSAKFGDDETQVRAAIAKDFSVPASAIHKSKELADRTNVLSVKVRDILQDGGAAEVSFVFGYKSKKLTQVNIVWSKETDKNLTPERLLANGEALRAYFLTQGYEPKTVASNALVRDGIILFRGADASGHTTALMLRGTAKKANKAATFVPNSLLVFYVADPKAPDVFKIQAGRF